MTLTSVTCTLDGFVFGTNAADSNGVVWEWQELAGWFDTTDLRVASNERNPVGNTITVARRNARQISMTALARMPNSSAPLDDLYWKSVRKIHSACDLSSRTGLLKVIEPDVTLQAQVRAAQPIRSRMFGNRHLAQFVIPLTAPDPRRYNFTQTSTAHAAGTFTVVNNGDVNTPPAFSTTGPATNVEVRSHTVSTNPILKWFGSLGGGDVLVIDTADQTVELNGADAKGQLNIANWWELAPGNNSVEFFQTSTIIYRDAYS